MSKIKLPDYVELTPLKHSQNKQIAMSWSMQEFKIEPEHNPFDHSAFAVFKKDKHGKHHHIGYIRKNLYQDGDHYERPLAEIVEVWKNEDRYKLLTNRHGRDWFLYLKLKE